MPYHRGELDHRPPKPPESQLKISCQPQPSYNFEQDKKQKFDELVQMVRDGNKMSIYAFHLLQKATNEASSSEDEICRLESEIDGLLSTIKGLHDSLTNNEKKGEERLRIRIGLRKGKEAHELLIQKKKQEELKLQAKIGYQQWILLTATTDPQFFVDFIEKQEAKKKILKEKETKEMEEIWRLYTLQGERLDAGLIALFLTLRKDQSAKQST